MTSKAITRSPGWFGHLRLNICPGDSLSHIIALSFEVLEAINSKTLAAARAAQERESKAREMALKAIAAKEVLLQRLRATTTAAVETTSAPPVSGDSLVDRRKALFDKRATTKRPRLPKGKETVLTAGQVGEPFDNFFIRAAE